MFSSQLVNHWFYNLINNKINVEILLLVLPRDNYYRKKLKDLFDKLQIKNYELIEISSIESINELEKNKNIIILGHSMMNINLLNNLRHCLLHTSWEGSYKSFLSNKHIEKIKKSSIKKSIKGRERYMYFYEQRNPITLLNPLDAYHILDYIRDSYYNIPQNIPFNFISQIFSYLYIYKYKDKRCSTDWKSLIEKDVFYLSKSNILTARLAILIYKATTFKLDDSDTRIGNYYRKQFSISSKTVRLPQNIYKIPTHTAAGYDLTDYFNKIKN